MNRSFNFSFDSNNGRKKSAKSHESSQTFILEPIYTPSGLVDGGDEAEIVEVPPDTIIDDLEKVTNSEANSDTSDLTESETSSSSEDNASELDDALSVSSEGEEFEETSVETVNLDEENLEELEFIEELEETGETSESEIPVSPDLEVIDNEMEGEESEISSEILPENSEAETEKDKQPLTSADKESEVTLEAESSPEIEEIVESSSESEDVVSSSEEVEASESSTEALQTDEETSQEADVETQLASEVTEDAESTELDVEDSQGLNSELENSETAKSVASEAETDAEFPDLVENNVGLLQESGEEAAIASNLEASNSEIKPESEIDIAAEVEKLKNGDDEAEGEIANTNSITIDKSEKNEENLESKIEDSEATLVASLPEFKTESERGVFVVGSTGEVKIDVLYDGGRYEGELGMFSLAGLEEFEDNPEAWMEAAKARVLDEGDLGNLVFSDATEAARFSGVMNESQDWNDGEYAGAKVFSMQVGDRFALVMSKNTSLTEAQLSDLIFSNNLNDPHRFVDVNGEGNLFAVEDWNDGDYNDLIFEVRGAEGSATELDEVLEEETEDWRETELGQEILDYADRFKFDSGVFTVSDSGEVSFDFLFDGGKYEGEVAVFSLENLEDLALESGSEEFIAEVASRALSNSEQGRVVIADRIEGAKFSGELGGESEDWNDGQYLGEKTIQMRPGDRFGVMLVPNSTVAKLVENPAVGGAKAPLFSMATANPEDAFHVGQLADVDGNGSTFVMEDMRVDDRSDRDYNDLIFRIRGATVNEAVSLDELAETGEFIDDWRDSELGEEILTEAESSDRAPVIAETVEEFSLAPSSNGISSRNFNLNTLFFDPEGEELNYELVDGDTHELNTTISGDRLSVSNGDKTGIQTVSVRAIDSHGNSVLQTVRIANSKLSSGDVAQLNTALSELQSAMNMVDDDPTVGLGSPEGERAIDKIGGLIRKHEGLSELFDEPEFLSQIGVNSSGVTTVRQLLNDDAFGSDLFSAGEGSTLGEALADTGNRNLDLYQMNASNLVEDIQLAQSGETSSSLDSIELQPETETPEAEGSTGAETVEETVEEDIVETDSELIEVDAAQLAELLGETVDEATAQEIAEILTAMAEEAEEAEISENFGESGEAENVGEAEISGESGDSQTEAEEESSLDIEDVRVRLTEKINEEVADTFVEWWNEATRETVEGDDDGYFETENLTEAIAQQEAEHANDEAWNDVKTEGETYREQLARLLEAASSDSDNEIAETNLGEVEPEEISQPETLAMRLVAAKQPSVLILDRGEHGTDVREAFESVNPLARVKVKNARDWASQLVGFVDSLEARGKSNGVVNLSFDLTQVDEAGNVTTRYELTPDEQIALQYALEHNVLVVAAAGNTASEMSALGRAAQRFDNVVTVGAIDAWGDRADYASFGEGLSLVTPGGEFEGEYQAFVGTSKSAAYVSGAAALAWAVNPGLNYQQVKKILTGTATDLGADGWDATTGAGLLNVEKAVRVAAETKPEKIASTGTLEIEEFSGAGRVRAALRLASPETQAAIAELIQRQDSLAQRRDLLESLGLGDALTPDEVLETLQAVETQNASSQVNRDRLETALELARRHDDVFTSQAQRLDRQVLQLSQELTLLEQEKQELDSTHAEAETALQQRISTTETELAQARQAYDELDRLRIQPPTAGELLSWAKWYEDRAAQLTQLEQEHRQIVADLGRNALPSAGGRAPLQQRHEHQANMAAAAAALSRQIAEKMTAGEFPETLLDSLQQQANANADWHGDRLNELANTTGVTGLLRASAREEHAEQRKLYEQLSSAADRLVNPKAALGAMADEIAVREAQLEAQNDALALETATYQQQAQALAGEIGRTQAELSQVEAQRDAAQQEAQQTGDRVAQLQAQIDAIPAPETLPESWVLLPPALQERLLQQQVTALKQRIDRLETLRDEDKTEEELAALDAEIQSVEAEIQSVQTQLGMLRNPATPDASQWLSTIATLQNEASTFDVATAEAAQAEVEAQLQAILDSNPDERDRLDELRDRTLELVSELDTAESNLSQAETALEEAQDDLKLITTEIETRQLQLQSLQDREVVAAAVQQHLSAIADEHRQKKWYWDDKAQDYVFNESEAQQEAAALEEASFVALEQNRIFQEIPKVQQRLGELNADLPQKQKYVNSLMATRDGLATEMDVLNAEIEAIADELNALNAVIEPLEAQEETVRDELEAATAAAEDVRNELQNNLDRQVQTLNHLIDYGLSVSPNNPDYFEAEIRPQIEAALTELENRHGSAFPTATAEAANFLRDRLATADETLAQLRSRDSQDIDNELEAIGDRIRALEALNASEDAAEEAIDNPSDANYKALADTVRDDLTTSVQLWTQSLRTQTQRANSLKAQGESLSQQTDNLLETLENTFLDPASEYHRSRADLRDAVNHLSVAEPRATQLEQAVSDTTRDIVRLKQRLAQDEALWNQIAPIAAEYGVDSLADLNALFDRVASEAEDVTGELAEAKNKLAEAEAVAAASLASAAKHEENAKTYWEQSRKNGPTWKERRRVCKEYLGGLITTCKRKTFIHIDHYWISWENSERLAQSLREQGTQALIDAQKYRQDIERLTPLAEAAQEANQAAGAAETAIEDVQTRIAATEAGQADIEATQRQLQQFQTLLPLLQTQARQSAMAAEQARGEVETGWNDFDAASEAYIDGLQDIVEDQGAIELAAEQALVDLASAERAIEEQMLHLGTELEQVLKLQSQLQNQLNAQATTNPDLEQALQDINNKATVLTLQQTALMEKREAIAAQGEVIAAEQALLEAIVQNPEANLDTLRQQLEDARSALSQAQERAENAETNSEAISADITSLTSDLLAQNDEHLKIVRNQQNTLRDVLEATQANAQLSLEAAQAQQELNNLEQQILTRLQEATKAGNQLAKHLLDVAHYNNLSTAAEIYYRDYQDLANDDGDSCMGGFFSADGDAIKSDQEWADFYHARLQEARSLQYQAQAAANEQRVLKDEAQAAIGGIQAQQNELFAKMNNLQTQIDQNQGNIAEKKQELAIIDAKVEALDRVRQQTEDTLQQLVTIEQLNLSQARLEQEMARDRESQIDDTVRALQEQREIELQRLALEWQYQLEKVESQQAALDFAQALNSARDRLGAAPVIEPGVDTPPDINNLVTQLQDIQAQYDLDPALQTLLAQTSQNLRDAAEGEEAAAIQDNLLDVMNALMAEVPKYKQEIAALEQKNESDRNLLNLAQSNLQEASQRLLAELALAEELQEQRELINPLYIESLVQVAFAENAVKISEDMARRAKEALENILKQREKARENRKKQLWLDVVGFISQIVSIAQQILRFTPLTWVSSVLDVVQVGLSVIQMAITGDWQNAIKIALTTGIKSITAALGLPKEVVENINRWVGVFEKAWSGIENITNGEELLGALQILSGVASGLAAEFEATLGCDCVPQGDKLILATLKSLEDVPLTVYAAVENFENGDPLAGAQNIFNAALSLGGNYSYIFDDRAPDTFKDLQLLGNAGFATAQTLEKLFDKEVGIHEWLSGISDIASIWKNPVGKAFQGTLFDGKPYKPEQCIDPKCEVKPEEVSNWITKTLDALIVAPKGISKGIKLLENEGWVDGIGALLKTTVSTARIYTNGTQYAPVTNALENASYSALAVAQIIDGATEGFKGLQSGGKKALKTLKEAWKDDRKTYKIKEHFKVIFKELEGELKAEWKDDRSLEDAFNILRNWAKTSLKDEVRNSFLDLLSTLNPSNVRSPRSVPVTP